MNNSEQQLATADLSGDAASQAWPRIRASRVEDVAVPMAAGRTGFVEATFATMSSSILR